MRMKVFLKIIYITALTILIFLTAFIFYYFAVTSKASLDEKKLVNLDNSIIFYDKDLCVINEETDGTSVTNIENIPNNLVNAFVAIEDKRFYKHNGIDYKRLFGASIKNLFSLSFKEGGSTISQQLIKNTHLSSEKTINRKLSEIKLARKLEKKYSKDEIMEKYLNTIYFGDNCYGVTSASKHYFGKNLSQLDINECATLASIIKAPSHYSPLSDINKCNSRKNLVLREMLNQGFINEQEYLKNVNLMPLDNVNETQDINYKYDYLYITKEHLKNSHEYTPYQLSNSKIYTYCDVDAQKILENSLNEMGDNYLKSAILMDRNSNIIAYYSNCGDVNRQLGSTIKPLIVYGPAIEENIVDSFTKVEDKKINFNGYSPANYNDKYYGETTVKTSLSKSMNSVAVQLLNYTGVNKSLDYANKVNLNLSENDNSLCLALGATENGCKLSQITSAYSVFLNKGAYFPSKTTKSITLNTNKTINNKIKSTNVFSYETVSIINDMLNYTVSNGTAKKLSFLPFSVYAKTGTVGNNNGNTDAYSISYTSDYLLGCWVGNVNEKLLDNNVTGGGLPSQISYNIWQELYKNKDKPGDIEYSKNVESVYIDKISYEEDGEILLAEEIAPEKYKEKIIINLKKYSPYYSTRFSNPKIESSEISVNSKGINISLCLPQYYYVEVYRECDGEKELLTTLHGKENYEFIDDGFKENIIYTYSLLPYYKDLNNKVFYGQEVNFRKIKAPSRILGDKWWCDEQ